MLITTCPHCRSRFRITLQHLTAAEGLVSCSRCHQVFQAKESLQEVEDSGKNPKNSVFDTSVRSARTSSSFSMKNWFFVQPEKESDEFAVELDFSASHQATPEQPVQERGAESCLTESTIDSAPESEEFAAVVEPTPSDTLALENKNAPLPGEISNTQSNLGAPIQPQPQPQPSFMSLPHDIPTRADMNWTIASLVALIVLVIQLFYVLLQR